MESPTATRMTNRNELKKLEKEHSEIVGEFQQCVEDGDQKNKPLEDIVKNQMMIM